MAKKSNVNKKKLDEIDNTQVPDEPERKYGNRELPKKKVITNPYGIPITLNINGKIIHIAPHKTVNLN